MQELTPLDVPYEPAAQMVHVLAPAVLYVPAEHRLCPVLPEHAYPASHVVQEDDVLTRLYVPAEQVVHADAPPREYDPAAQLNRDPPTQ